MDGEFYIHVTEYEAGKTPVVRFIYPREPVRDTFFRTFAEAEAVVINEFIVGAHLNAQSVMYLGNGKWVLTGYGFRAVIQVLQTVDIDNEEGEEE